MPNSKDRLAEIDALPDGEIDTSDIPEMDEQFFSAAKLVLPPGTPTVRRVARLHARAPKRIMPRE